MGTQNDVGEGYVSEELAYSCVSNIVAIEAAVSQTFEFGEIVTARVFYIQNIVFGNFKAGQYGSFQLLETA